MNKTMMILVCTLFLSIGVEFHPNNLKVEGPDLSTGQVPVVIWSTIKIPDLLQQDSIYPIFQLRDIDAKVAGVSTVGAKNEVVKAGLDAEAGRVNWRTAMIVFLVAIFVYLINKSKKQDIE